MLPSAVGYIFLGVSKDYSALIFAIKHCNHIKMSMGTYQTTRRHIAGDIFSTTAVRSSNFATSDLIYCMRKTGWALEGEFEARVNLNILKPSGNFTYHQV
jgi:hypothetical protein